MSNLKLTFIVDKQKVRNQKFFVYKNKKYPIDFDLLIKNSNYFYKYRQQYEEVEDIELLNDTKDEYNFPDESIEAFVNCCQNKQCEIESTSIFSLQYLSSKYEYPEIITITNEFIKEHSDELVYESLLFKTRQIKIKEEHNFIDTSNEEEIISRNLDKYINTNKNMTQLPIPILNRIISKYFEQQKDNKNKQQNTKIINFLFDVLKEKGTEGSILFNNIDFGEENIGVINKLLNEYSNIFDFNMINSTLLKTTNQITNEMNKQQEEYSKLFSNMKKEFELQKEELYKIQNEAIKHRDEYENRLKQLENKYQKEIMNIKKDNEMIIVQLFFKFFLILKHNI